MDDLAYMKNPDRWIQLVCPLKRYVKRNTRYQNVDLEFAYLTGSKPILVHGSMFNPQPADKLEEFPSHEAIVAEGWKVD